tara:strand:- start:315 stop:476 length:162 start_codon:yes stop_codon:yes gene_type:complete
MAKYKKVNILGGSTLSCIKDTETNAIIPLDQENTDYQEYLKWVDEGNTPEAAD